MSKEIKKDIPLSKPEQSPLKLPEIHKLRENIEKGSNKLEKGERSDTRRPTMETPIPTPKKGNQAEG